MCIPNCVGLVGAVVGIVALDPKVVMGVSLMDGFRFFFLTTFLASLDGSVVFSVCIDCDDSTTLVVIEATGFGFDWIVCWGSTLAVKDDPKSELSNVVVPNTSADDSPRRSGKALLELCSEITLLVDSGFVWI